MFVGCANAGVAAGDIVIDTHHWLQYGTFTECQIIECQTNN